MFAKINLSSRRWPHLLLYWCYDHLIHYYSSLISGLMCPFYIVIWMWSFFLMNKICLLVSHIFLKSIGNNDSLEEENRKAFSVFRNVCTAIASVIAHFGLLLVPLSHATLGCDIAAPEMIIRMWQSLAFTVLWHVLKYWKWFFYSYNKTGKTWDSIISNP